MDETTIENPNAICAYCGRPKWGCVCRTTVPKPLIFPPNPYDWIR